MIYYGGIDQDGERIVLVASGTCDRQTHPRLGQLIRLEEVQLSDSRSGLERTGNYGWHLEGRLWPLDDQQLAIKFLANAEWNPQDEIDELSKAANDLEDECRYLRRKIHSLELAAMTIETVEQSGLGPRRNRTSAKRKT